MTHTSTEQERVDTTVFKRLLNDYVDCLRNGDFQDAGAALLAVVAEYQQAARRAPVAEVPEAIEQMAVERYKVVPSHESMFHRWAVVAGNGTQQLYIGREVECLNMAREFTGAFLDGAFLAMQNTAPAQPVAEPAKADSVLEDALSDAVRVPLDSLHADAAYLIGRLREGSMPYARVIEIIRERIDAASPTAQAAESVPGLTVPPAQEARVTCHHRPACEECKGTTP